MVKDGKKGQQEAHTQAAGGPDDAAQALPGADPAALLDGSPDLAPVDVLELMAEPVLAQRRARGRPQGAANRKNGDMIRFLAAKGHRDPWETLSLIQSTDFRALCKLVGATSAKLKVQVLAVQKSAAEALMNYHHSKKPQQLDLPVGAQRPIMIIGDGNNVAIAQSEFASAEFLPPNEIEENQQLIEGEAVRDKPAKSDV